MPRGTTHARALSEEALSLHQELEHKKGRAELLSGLGEVTRLQGDLGQAAAICEESMTLFQELSDHDGLAFARIGLGRVVQDQEDVERAAALYRASLAYFRDEGNQRGIAECLERLGSVIAAAGQQLAGIQRAARLWGAAEALREAISASLPPVDRIEHAQVVANARTQLDAAAFTTAWAEGRALPLEQAIALALAADALGGAGGEQ